MKNIFLILILCFFETLHAQETLYGIKNIAQTYKFVSINCNTDSISEYAAIPLNFYTSDFSSCYDATNKKYFYCTGQKMFVIDVTNGQITDTLDFSFIHPAYLHHVVYNSKDGFIYGIKVDNATLLQHFTRYDPANNQLTDVAAISGIFVGIGCKSSINALKQEYIVQSTSLAAIDIASGNVLYNLPIQNVGGEVFDHIAYSCKLQNVFGLSNNPQIPENFLAEIDTGNATVNHIHPSPLPVYYYKHYLGGSSIDNNTDIFYYPAVGGKIYGIDINSGNVAYEHDYGPGLEILFIESASDYYCPVSSIHEVNEQYNLHLFPNPVSNMFTLISKFNEEISLKVFNSLGQEQIIEYVINNDNAYFELNTSTLQPGIYFLELQMENKSIVKKFVKQ